MEKGNVIGKEESVKRALPTLKRKRVTGLRLLDSYRDLCPYVTSLSTYLKVGFADVTRLKKRKTA